MRGHRDCQAIYGIFVKVETYVLLCRQKTNITFFAYDICPENLLRF